MVSLGEGCDRREGKYYSWHGTVISQLRYVGTNQEFQCESPKWSLGIMDFSNVTIVLRGEPCVDSMIQWREGEKEKDSIYIQRIMRKR